MSSRFSWRQELEVVIITVPCSNPIINKKGYFDLQITRTYAKFHLKSPKIFMDFDLKYNINPSSPLNNALTSPEGLQIILAKEEPGQDWDELLCKDKTEAKNRRDLSLAEWETQQKEQDEIIEKQKIENDRFSVREQMRLETERRKVIEDKKAAEKQQALSDIFGGPTTTTEIFEERTEIPDVRNSHKQTLTFTTKTDPNLPARENKEPPVPKNLKPLDGPAHETHPLWLKDKGDAFFQENDFNSAINAYNKALQTDPKFFPALVNRSAALMCLQEFNRALEDITCALNLSETQENTGILYARKGAILAYKGLIAEGIDSYKEAIALLPEEQSLLEDLESLEKRRSSNLVKVEADHEFRNSRFQEAKEKYIESLDIDTENEVALANLAQVYLNLGEEKKCEECCDQSLQLITHNTDLKVKVLLRKAKVIYDNEEALQLVQKALNLDSANAEALKMQKALSSEVNSAIASNFKHEADEALRAGKAQDALALYKKALAPTKDKALKASLLTNMSACHLMMKEFHDTVITVDRAFKIEPSPSLALRLYWRRAKAYAELGQLFTAQADLKQALKLDPQNELLLKDIEILNAQINS